MAEQSIHGCKAALFIGDKLLVILRDNIDTIPFPNMWDLVGGGCEDNETAEETIIREIEEEVGLRLQAKDLIWKARYKGDFYPGTQVLFFVAKLDAAAEQKVVFGDEGQEWKLVSVNEFFEMENVVPSYAERLRHWIESSDVAKE